MTARRTAPDMGLYVITAAVPELGRDHIDVAMAAIEGGADAIQLRIKRRSMGEALKVAKAVHALTQEAGIPLVINDHVGIAMASGAEGLHVGQDDIPLTSARMMLGDDVVIGFSTGGKPAEAIRAERDGASYVGVGPVYATTTKRDAGPPVGLARIAKLKAVVSLPVVAVGGIDASNLGACIEAGADAVAVISAITMAEDMVAATRSLKATLEEARNSVARKG